MVIFMAMSVLPPQAARGDFALCGARPGALPLDPAAFEKAGETFILLTAR